ncbi:hypothetical protein TYRP_009931 [Tyrophagus putrescentiae]|nr:hypothetical protein TYRP_009931 [Tyrophagus putrescentiae]
MQGEVALVEPRFTDQIWSPEQAGGRGGLGDRSSGTPEGAGGLTNGPVPGGKPPPTPPRLVGKPESPEETTAHESISSESLRHTVAIRLSAKKKVIPVNKSKPEPAVIKDNKCSSDDQ